MGDEKYLAIKNWRKYQTIDDDKGRAPFVKDYVDKDLDPDRMKLTGFVTNVLDRLYRLRARTSHILHNDITWLSDAMHTYRTDRPHVSHAIRTLISHNFIIPTNDENFEGSAAVEVRKGRGKGKVDLEREIVSSTEKIKPNPSGSFQAKDKSNPKKDCGCADGLCDWSEPTGGNLAKTIGDAIYYQRHIKKNDWFIPKLTAGYVRQQWQRILNDTPEDYVYDPDPMIKEKRVHVDGEQPRIGKEVVRRPKNAAERVELLKDPDRNRKWLYDPACLHGCKEGLVFVSDNPDAENPMQRLLGHSEYCECVTKEETQ